MSDHFCIVLYTVIFINVNVNCIMILSFTAITIEACFDLNFANPLDKHMLMFIIKNKEDQFIYNKQ